MAGEAVGRWKGGQHQRRPTGCAPPSPLETCLAAHLGVDAPHILAPRSELPGAQAHGVQRVPHAINHALQASVARSGVHRGCERAVLIGQQPAEGQVLQLAGREREGLNVTAEERRAGRTHISMGHGEERGQPALSDHFACIQRLRQPWAPFPTCAFIFHTPSRLASGAQICIVSAARRLRVAAGSAAAVRMSCRRSARRMSSGRGSAPCMAIIMLTSARSVAAAPSALVAGCER